MQHDADEILARMRADRDHPWPQRLVARIAREAREPLPLTANERDTLRVMAHGQTVEGAAVLLGVSVDAVRSRLKVARLKLRAKNTTHAVALAIWKGEL